VESACQLCICLNGKRDYAISTKELFLANIGEGLLMSEASNATTSFGPFIFVMVDIRSNMPTIPPIL
jgi:hypothetical protein